MSDTDTTPDKREDDATHGFLGQPRALANIFGVEMWERFSFYGMQGILLIYLYYTAEQGGLGIDQPTAAGVVGAYTSGGIPRGTPISAAASPSVAGLCAAPSMTIRPASTRTCRPVP